jgi:hypothetical protein
VSAAANALPREPRGVASAARPLLLLLPLALAGCISHYQPPLVTSPSDPQKYEADRQACLTEAKERRQATGTSGMASTITGTFGRFAPGQEADDPSTYRGEAKIIDDCMIRRGYDVLGAQKQ